MYVKILEKMGFKPSSHNEIFLDHLEVITDFLIERCPIESKKALLMLRGSTGISTRYVKEHIDSLLAWGIIRKHSGNFEWMLEGCQEKKIVLEELKNEDVPDTFPGYVGEHKQCVYKNDLNVCNFNPDKPFAPTVTKCERCIARKEL